MRDAPHGLGAQGERQHTRFPLGCPCGKRAVFVSDSVTYDDSVFDSVQEDATDGAWRAPSIVSHACGEEKNGLQDCLNWVLNSYPPSSVHCRYRLGTRSAHSSAGCCEWSGRRLSPPCRR